MKNTELEAWLTRNLAELLGLSEAAIDPQAAFSSYGLDSANAIPIAGELEDMLGTRLSPTLLFEYPSVRELSNHLGTADVPKTAARSVQEPEFAAREAGEPVAIIGIGCRFPHANGPDQFWSLLKTGSDAISEVPAERWDVNSFFDPDPLTPGKTISRWGGFVDDADRFDAAFFAISPREATRMDPQQRLLLETTYEALENAAIRPDQIGGSRTGVFVGISHSEYSERQYADPRFIDAYAATSNSLSIASNRISYALDLRGPSVSIDTACSSSLVAVHYACTALRRGEVTLAVAGGVSLNFAPEISVAITKAGIMAPDGRCKPFDARANGYVRGEGVAMVVLKRLSAALADGDPIWAVIRGTAISQDGRTNGMMAPNQQAQEAVIREACSDAGIEPRELDYVEAHGTGTYLGDAIEAKALGKAVGAGRTSGEVCLIGSVKSNIGHLEPAAGIAGLVKLALALRHGELPRNLHYQTPNPEIPWDELNLQVVAEHRDWPAQGRGLAGLSSFGFGGTNAHAILERAPAPTAPPESGASARFLPLSARSAASLRSLAEQYCAVLEASPDRALESICATAIRARNHFAHRLAVVGETRSELVERLRVYLRGGRVAGLEAMPSPREPQPLLFVFSGQGAAWAGMARDLLEQQPVFAASCLRCDELFADALGRSVIAELRTADEQALGHTELAQPLIFTVQVGLVALLQSWGLAATAVVGHSLGELAGACAAGMLSLEQAVQVVAARARAMASTHGTGAMLSVALAGADADALCETFSGGLTVAAYNGPRSCTLAGDSDAIKRVASELAAQGTAVRELELAYAFHSAHMDRCLPELERALPLLTPQGQTAAFYSSVTGARLTSDALDGRYIVRNVREPVRFYQALRAALEELRPLVLELSPHTVLARDVQAALQELGQTDLPLATLSKGKAGHASLASLAAALYARGHDLNWSALGSDDAPRAHLPSQPWKRERYWAEFGEPSTASSAPKAGEHPLLASPIELANARDHALWNQRVASERMRRLGLSANDGGVSSCAALDALLAMASRVNKPPFALSDVSFAEYDAASAELLELQGQLTADGSGKHNLALYVRSSSDAAWTLRASSSVRTHARKARQGGLADAKAHCTEPFPVDTLRATVSAEQSTVFEHEPVLRQITRGPDAALARVGLPESLRIDAQGCVVHPLLLEAGLLLLRTCEPEPYARITTGVERVVVHAALPALGYLHFELVARETDAIDADLRLYDDAGQCALELINVRAERVVAHAQPAADPYAGLSFYELSWRKLTEQLVENPSNAFQPYVLLADRAGFADLLIEELRGRGRECLILEPDLAVPARRQELRENLRKLMQAQAIAGVIHMYGLDAPALDADAQLELGEELTCLSALHTVQTIASTNASHAFPRVWLVTREAQGVEDGAPPRRLSQSALWGFARSLAYELPDLRPTIVDLADDLALVGALADEIVADGPEIQVALRTAGRFVPRFTETPAPAPIAPWSHAPERTCLITGGLGGLGLCIARHAVEHGARRLVLTGRKGPDDAAKAVIGQLEAMGASVELAACDVADRPRTAALLTDLRARGHVLGAVFHAAGVLDNGPLLELDDVRFKRATAAKIAGSWNLHELTKCDDLQQFVLFSSVASMIGPPGQANYTAGNAFVDALAALRQAEGRPVLNVNWGPWAEVGLAARTLAQMNSNAGKHLSELIAPSQGVDVLGRLLHQTRAQLMVLPWRLEQVAQLYPQLLRSTIFREVDREQSSASVQLREEKLYERPLLKTPYVAPSDDLQAQIAAIWSRALHIEQIGIHDSFFELGGDSVLGAQIVTQVNRRFGVSLSLRNLFSVFDVEQLALAVQSELLKKVEQLSEEDAQRLLAHAPSGELSA